MAIPLWVLGKHLTAVSVTPLQEDADGNLVAVAGAQTLIDVIHEVRIASQPATENISALARPKANHVVTEDDSSIVIRQILTRRRYGSNAKKNVIPWLVANYDHFEITFTRVDTWTGRFTRGPFSDGVTSKGANYAELTCLQVDDAASGLTYSSS